MREFLRVALARHRLGALLCALTTAAIGAAVTASLPKVWRVNADVYLTEPTAIHRIANPFAPVPSQRDGLNELPDELTSRDRVIALVKRNGLIDQWDGARPWALHLKDRLMALVRGPVSERDLLDALVVMVERRLDVAVQSNHVRVSFEWPSRDVAIAVVEGTLVSLEQLRLTRDAEALDVAARSLDDQLAGVRAELTTRAQRIETELARASAEHRWASVDADREQLRRDGSRAAELMVRAEEKHVAADVMRHSNALRFIVVRPPERPRHPEGPSWPMLVFLTLLASALSGVVGACALSIASGRVTHADQLVRELRLPVTAHWRGLWPTRAGSASVGKWGLAVAAALAIATGLSLGLSRGNPGLALAPLIVVVGAWTLWTVPLKYPLLALMLAAVTLDDPSDKPFFALWHSPLYPAGKVLFGNVAWFTGFELSVMALTVLMYARRVLGAGRRALLLDPVAGQAPRALRLSIVLSAATILWLVVLGVARGGIFREALWQFRILLMMPLVCTLALYAFDFPRDLKPLFRVLVAGSMVKALLGTYFMYAIAFPSGQYPPHTTGHNDTMLFVTATVMCFLLIWEKPVWRHLGTAALWMPFIAMALRLNDRRIAYVDIAIVLAFIYLASPLHRTKRFATRVGATLIPFVALFFLAGWDAAPTGVFKPVAKVRAIVAPKAETKEDSSNAERDIENFNVLHAWEQNMFIGQGFGHAFKEIIPTNDFSQSNFGHVAHNSVLWLFWIGGVTGFTGIFLYLAIAAFYLGRTLRRTVVWRERVALLTALTIMLTYLLQAFGDMGTQSMQFVFCVAAAVAVIGRLASHAGLAPPAPLPAETAPETRDTASQLRLTALARQ